MGESLVAPSRGIRRSFADSISADALDPRPAFLAPCLYGAVEEVGSFFAFQNLYAGRWLSDLAHVLHRRVACRYRSPAAAAARN